MAQAEAVKVSGVTQARVCGSDGHKIDLLREPRHHGRAPDPVAACVSAGSSPIKQGS
jgi:hypothetical protein